MYRKVVKNILDFLIGLCGFPFFLLALMIFGPIIYLTDKGPIFYNANRIGKDGKLFRMYKNFTTAEGGASTWRDIPSISNEEIYHQFQLYSLHGQSKDALAKTQIGAWEYDIIGPWYKCNMTDIMAAIGLRQLDRYPAMLERRREIIKRYDSTCDELGVLHLNPYSSTSTSSGHLYLTRIPGVSDKERREIIVKLAERGVNCNVHYKPLPMMTAYKEMGWDIKDFPNAFDYCCNLITLPLHTKLSDSDVDYVIENFREVVGEYL